MGAIPAGQYEQEIVERTIKLIKGYKGVYSITLLVNSLLSLLVLPQQKTFRSNRTLLNTPINQIPEIASLIHKQDFFFDSGSTKKGKNPDTLKHLLRTIRNGISHQHIIPISDATGVKWIGVTIEDIYKGNHSLTITFTTAELKAFSLFIANNFLLKQL